MLTISTSPVMQKVLVGMGTVDGCGYDGQQKDVICDVRGPCQICERFEVHSSQFFRWFQLIGYAYESLRCLHVEIWRFSWCPDADVGQPRTDDFIPAYARGVTTWISVIIASWWSCDSWLSTIFLACTCTYSYKSIYIAGSWSPVSCSNFLLSLPQQASLVYVLLVNDYIWL